MSAQNPPQANPPEKRKRGRPKGGAPEKKQEGSAKKGKLDTRAPLKRPWKAQGWVDLYLEELAETGARTDSAKKVGVAYKTVWKHARDDADFAAAVEEAMKIAIAGWENEARRRAVEGCQQITYGPNGEVKSVRIEYSDTILLRMLARSDPTWRDKQEVTHSGGMAVTMTRAERLARLEEARAKAKKPLA